MWWKPGMRWKPGVRSSAAAIQQGSQGPTGDTDGDQLQGDSDQTVEAAAFYAGSSQTVQWECC